MERRFKMVSAKRILIAVSIIVAVSAMAPSIALCQGADESNWPARVNFSMPVRVGSLELSPGMYDIQLTSGTWARSVVAFYSLDQRRWVGMVMGINDTRQDASKMSGFTFENMGPNEPSLLESWFYPGWNRGVRFVYPGGKSNAVAQAMVEPSK